MIIVLGIGVGILVLIMMMTQGKSSGGGNGSIKSLSQYVNKTNELIYQYNDLRNIFTLSAQEKREAILDCEDSESLQNLSEIEKQFNEAADRADGIINDIKDNLKDGHCYPQAYKDLADQITFMDSYLKNMKDIIPEKHEHEWGRNSFASDEQPQAQGDTSTEDYFQGCNTKEEIDKRYRALCKVFHPDSSTGDTEAFKNLQKSYEGLVAKL